MDRSLVQGIEVTKDGDQLVLRNTWAVATLGGHFLVLAIGVGFFGCCGFLGLAPADGETPRDRTIGTAMAVVGIPVAMLSLLALPLGLLRHRRPFTLDREADCLWDGGKEVCALSDIREVSVDEWGSDPTEYLVNFVLADGHKLLTLNSRINFQQDSAERVAAEIADFLGIGVVGPGQRNRSQR